MSSAPYNIIVGPIEAWLQAYDHTGGPIVFPALTAEPDSPWVGLAQSQSQEYNDDGVSIGHPQTIDEHRFLGGTGPRKATRSEESLSVEITVHDMRLESYAIALSKAVTETGDNKIVNIYRGFDVNLYSLLVRGQSPYGPWKMQYEIPVVYVGGEPDVVYNKTDPAGLLMSFNALEYAGAETPDERFGRIIAQAQEPD